LLKIEICSFNFKKLHKQEATSYKTVQLSGASKTNVKLFLRTIHKMYTNLNFQGKAMSMNISNYDFTIKF